jgi:hypothetical protein
VGFPKISFSIIQDAGYEFGLVRAIALKFGEEIQGDDLLKVGGSKISFFQ